MTLNSSGLAHVKYARREAVFHDFLAISAAPLFLRIGAIEKVNGSNYKLLSIGNSLMANGRLWKWRSLIRKRSITSFGRTWGQYSSWLLYTITQTLRPIERSLVRGGRRLPITKRSYRRLHCAFRILLTSIISAWGMWINMRSWNPIIAFNSRISAYGGPYSFFY